MDRDFDEGQLLDGPAADAVKQQARFYGPLDLQTSGWRIAPQQFVEFDGRDCLELKLVGPGGGTSLVYVDATTFLSAGTKQTVETPIGTVESKMFLRNYRDLGGFITPTEIAIESSVQRQLIRIERVSFEAIEPEEYRPPSTR